MSKRSAENTESMSAAKKSKPIPYSSSEYLKSKIIVGDDSA